ncbi:hypothetical protein LTR15_010717 [Elasticomyces elasticus]|nr:hypothetical protein LTR15_010717 [Elasticomyces elasticus]
MAAWSSHLEPHLTPVHLHPSSPQLSTYTLPPTSFSNVSIHPGSRTEARSYTKLELLLSGLIFVILSDAEQQLHSTNTFFGEGQVPGIYAHKRAYITSAAVAAWYVMLSNASRPVKLIALLGNSLSKSEYTVVNLGHGDGPPRLVTCVKSSQGFDWNQGISNEDRRATRLETGADVVEQSSSFHPMPTMMP